MTAMVSETKDALLGVLMIAFPFDNRRQSTSRQKQTSQVNFETIDVENDGEITCNEKTTSGIAK